jgi:hypothetical protein
MDTLAASPILSRRRPEPMVAYGRTARNTDRQEREKVGHAAHGAEPTGRRWSTAVRSESCEIDVQLHLTNEAPGEKLAILRYLSATGSRRQTNKNDCGHKTHGLFLGLRLPPNLPSEFSEYVEYVKQAAGQG